MAAKISKSQTSLNYFIISEKSLVFLGNLGVQNDTYSARKHVVHQSTQAPPVNCLAMTASC
jgi:hypothetical protein